MKTLSGAVLLGCLALSGTALADADLAAKKQCMQCHKLKEDFAAPSFHKIAQARKNQRDAVANMMATIRRGSDGSDGTHWGKAKMPDMSERPLVSPSEARTLAEWVLKQ